MKMTPPSLSCLRTINQYMSLALSSHYPRICFLTYCYSFSGRLTFIHLLIKWCHASGSVLGPGLQQLKKKQVPVLTCSFPSAAPCHSNRPEKKFITSFSYFSFRRLHTIISWSPNSQPWLKVYNQLALPHVASLISYIRLDAQFLN